MPEYVQNLLGLFSLLRTQSNFEYEKLGTSQCAFKSTAVSDIFNSATQHLLLRIFMRMTALIFALGRK